MRARVIWVAAVSLVACGCEHTESPQAGSAPVSRSYTSADVDQALNDARRFAREGKHEQALERHVWYHKNALKYAPAHYGVRLSFALGDWSQLGKVYPKALDALRSTRDETPAGYRKAPSDSRLYSEVMSLNIALDDFRAAKELFYEGRQKGISDTLLTLRLDQVLATGDMKWAREVIGDPKENLEEIKQKRDSVLSAMRMSENPERFTKDLDEMYASTIATLVKAIAKTHGLSAARDVQKEALRFLDSPLIRNALKGR